MKLLVPPIALFLLATEALACKCSGPAISDLREALLFKVSTSDVAFEGKLTNVTVIDATTNAVTFKVNHCVKGNCGTSIVVYDDFAGTSCSQGFANNHSVGKRYWVAASIGKIKGTYSFNECGGFVVRSSKQIPE